MIRAQKFNEDADIPEEGNNNFYEKNKFLITNQVIDDITIYIQILYTALIEFYRTVLTTAEIYEMKESLYESTTTLILKGDT